MERTAMRESLRKRIYDAVTGLLNEENDIDSLRQYLIQINRVFTDISSVRGEESDDAKKNYITLPGGIAISPEFAAMNLRDVLRTTKYLRGIKAAIDATLERLNGERVHLLYPGCGPYGTLVLPLLTLYNPKQLKVTLLEIQPKSLASVRDVCNALGFTGFIGGIVQTDASLYKHPDDDPIHIVAMECMLHALAREPQVSISRNVSAQLVEEGILIPEEIRVAFYAIDPEIEFKMTVTDEEKEKSRFFLGDIFVLDKHCHKLEIQEAHFEDAPYLQASTITLPDDLPPLMPLMFFTELKVFGDIMLSYYESGITHPLVVGQKDSFERGDELTFKYRLASYPEFYYEKTKADPWA